MARWSDIERYRKDVSAARAMARGLRLTSPDALTDWEEDFLEGIEGRDLTELSERQAEKLLEIRDDVEMVSSWKGFSVNRLITGCFERRDELSEGDQDWIADLWTMSPQSIRRKHVSRLGRCSRQVGLIDGWN